MRKYILLTIVVLAIWPVQMRAAGEVKTLTGVTIRTGGSQIIFKATSGATYSADISSALLARRFGSSLLFSEIIPGDKVQVTGRLWEDNSLSATSLKDMSLYPHNSTFTAKIMNLDPYNLSFTMQSRSNGTQTVHTNSLTIFKMNNAPSGLNELEPGMNVKVKGVWERSSVNLSATSVEALVRMLNIEVTGILKGKDGNNLTVIGNGNVLYGINAAAAKIVSKNNKPMEVGEIKLDDILKITGKHRSEDTKIVPSKIKDLSLNK